MTHGSLMKVESIAECSPWSILQYFWPALSDNWSWKPIYGLFESGRFTQVLLYMGCVGAFRPSQQFRLRIQDSAPGESLTSDLSIQV